MKNIKIVLISMVSLVLVLGLVIQFTRVNTVIKLKENTSLMDYDIKEINDMKKKFEEKVHEDKYLILHDSNEEYLVEISKNIEQTLNYMKKSYRVDNLDSRKENIQDFNKIIVVIEDLEKVNNMNELFELASEGGSIFFANRLLPSGAYEENRGKFGVEKISNAIESYGIRLLDSLLIGGKGVEVRSKEYISNSSVDVKLMDNTKLHAESIDNISLLWSHDYGKGKIVYFNGTMLLDKSNRGLISGALSLMKEEDIYPIINTKINFIDDFPSPVPEGSTEYIEKRYNRSIEDFYKEIWWPDVLQTSLKNDYKYTGVIIATYFNETENIKDDPITIKRDHFSYYTNEILSAGGEIGIHGYNHQPLVLEELYDQELGYKPWKNQKVMEESLRKVVSGVKKLMPNYTLNVYVPPSNIIGRAGIEAIKNSTDVKIIASLYNAGIDIDSYEQEIEIDEDNFIHLPRTISGYDYSEEMSWKILNGVNSLGYFSHFAHPDDIIDPYRSRGKEWTELVELYNEMQKEVFDKYRWLNGLSATEAGNRVITFLSANVDYEKTEDTLSINCENLKGDLSFVFKTSRSIERTEGCEYEKIDEGAYLINAKEKVSKIYFKR